MSDEVKIELTLSAEDAAEVHRIAREMGVSWNEVIRRGLGFYFDAVKRERRHESERDW